MLVGGSQRTARRWGYPLLLERCRGVLVHEGLLTCHGGDRIPCFYDSTCWRLTLFRFNVAGVRTGWPGIWFETCLDCHLQVTNKAHFEVLHSQGQVHPGHLLRETRFCLGWVSCARCAFTNFLEVSHVLIVPVGVKTSAPFRPLSQVSRP